MISEVFNCDCMEFMKTIPDGFFDLAIVDPPYGIGATNGTGKYGRLKFQGKKECWDKEIPSPEYFFLLKRISKNQIIWGGNYFGLPPTRGFIVWDKAEGFKDRDFAECEYAWTSFDCNAKIFKYDPLARGDYKEKINPCQKPVALYKWLLQNYANPGDKIFDSHMGSQSSRIAAHIMGFDFWGCEIDPEYFQDGCARFDKVAEQGMLFTQESLF